jgi:rubredoxin
VLAATPQQDHGCRLAGVGGGAWIQLLDGVIGHALLCLQERGRVCQTSRPLAEAATAQKWICESCGFIYHPEEGDPDGGIAPGTAFEQIPDDWFCPVCGARKKDFVPYED